MTWMKPGEDIIKQGLADLADGLETVPSLLVLIGAPRLRRLGITVPASNITTPEHRLYAVLCAQYHDAAHSKYNALIRRLVSFARSAECVN